MADLDLYIDNDNALTVKVRDAVSATDLSGATVTVTIEETGGTDVTGETWPLAMSYVSTTTLSDGSSGYLFRATLADTLTLAAATDYQAVVIADNGAGQRAKWTIPVTAAVRAS